MRTLPTSSCAAFGFIVAIVALLAVAQTATAAPQTEAERHALVYSAQAKSAFAGGRYGEAAELFMKAYAKIPEPTLVYNAARAYQKAGRGTEALPLFRLYLQLEPAVDAPTRAGRAAAQQHIREIEVNLRQQAAKRAADKAARQREASQTNPAAAPPQPTSAPSTPVPPQVPKPAAVAPVAPGQTPTGRKVVHRPDLFQRVSRLGKPAGWSTREKEAVVIGSVGAAMLLTGLTLHAIETDLEALDDSPRGQPTVRDGRTFYAGVTQREFDDKLSSNNAASTIGNVLIFGGVVAGGVAAWMWTTSPTAKSVGLAPTRGGAVLLARGRF